jgi:hypothetical protein
MAFKELKKGSAFGLLCGPRYLQVWSLNVDFDD